MSGPLSRIFPLFVLAMWVTFGVWLAQGEWSWLNWAMLGLATFLTAIIFIDFVSVFNIGYATCMIALPVLILAVRGVTLAGALVGGLTFLYGVRLLAFVVQRRRSTSYAAARVGEKMADKNLPSPIKVLLFVLVTSLQTFEAMPTYVAASVGETSTILYVGAALMLVGLVVETIADQQKYVIKQRDPKAFAATGLFARTRHPNYTGEIVFQFGLAIAALGATEGWWQVAAVVLAPAYIAVLMWFQTKSGDTRLESKRQVLERQFLAMEQSIAAVQTQSQTLGQISLIG